MATTDARRGAGSAGVECAAGAYHMPCPYCGAPCECDLADVGVGYVQCGPYHCDACEAYEAGAYDDTPDDLARIDNKTGWFPPGSVPGSTANMLDGRLATAEETREAYYARFAGSLDYEAPGVVTQWFAEQRRVDDFNAAASPGSARAGAAEGEGAATGGGTK